MWEAKVDRAQSDALGEQQQGARGANPALTLLLAEYHWSRPARPAGSTANVDSQALPIDT